MEQGIVARREGGKDHPDWRKQGIPGIRHTKKEGSILSYLTGWNDYIESGGGSSKTPSTAVFF